MKRKILAAVVATVASAALVASGGAGASAADTDTPLTKYVKFADGTYGYDAAQPVYTYPGSGQQVVIPGEYSEPKNQFRSSWVATIANLNFGKTLTESAFIQQYDTVLSEFQSWNMNAVIFQVRPLLDAYYPSDINPWSESITGVQGTDPGFDPLQIMVDRTHAAGLEYHAWFNPYRVTNTKITTASILTRLGLTAAEANALSPQQQVAALAAAGILSPDNFAVQHPEWVLRFDEKLFLNPGIPEVRAHMAATIAEVVENYDIDAIHFDDYFYPYRITVNGVNVLFGQAGEDRATFEQYGIPAGYADTQAGIEQWRRNNVTSLITDVGDTIDAHNAAAGTAVQFGVSPFGIWEHSALDPRGSHTPTGSSQSFSSTIFADTYGWVKDELVDYIVPQVYWAFDQAAAPYGELAQWWNDAAEGTRVQVYIGHANYKHVSNGGFDAAWMNPQEIPNQLRFNQNLDNVYGSAFFSYNDIRPTDLSTVTDLLKPRNQAKNDSIAILKSEYYTQTTLVPAKPWLSQQTVQAPANVVLNGSEVTWDAPASPDTSRFYVVYSGTGTPESIAASGANIVKRVWAGDAASLALAVSPAAGETVVITAVDAAGVESAPVAARVPAAPVTVTYVDANGATLAPSVTLTGYVGDAYDTSAATVAGYTLTATPPNASGVFSAAAQQVAYVYAVTQTPGNGNGHGPCTPGGPGNGHGNANGHEKGNGPCKK